LCQYCVHKFKVKEQEINTIQRHNFKGYEVVKSFCARLRALEIAVMNIPYAEAYLLGKLFYSSVQDERGLNHSDGHNTEFL